MIISELNYLESAEAEVVGGEGININSNFYLNKDVYANVYVNEDFYKDFYTNTSGLEGSVAEVLGTADAKGKDTFSSIIFGVQTEPGKSESFVNATAATAPYYYW
ncbi:hypothetical protein ACP6PL_07265 [Dapis sp. BLCC M126]|uniref:hypothetical protein n=1 Tax=Dapis sp. BLCC M126 TaxID=3400189 RepID=UPI003CE73123